MKSKVELRVMKHPTHIQPYIDGEELPFCDSVIPRNKSLSELDFKIRDGIIFNDYVEADLSDFTKIAIIILRSELIKHGDLYNGFKASIQGGINDCLRNPQYEEECQDRNLSEFILDRLVGEI